MNTPSIFTLSADLSNPVRSDRSASWYPLTTSQRRSRVTPLIAAALTAMLYASAPGVTLAAGFVTATGGQGHSPGQLFVHGGLATMPLAASGLRDAHLSDWQACGLGADGSCPEGRVALPMAAGNGSGPRFGLRLGATFWLSSKLGAVAEATVVAGAVQGASITVGVDYVLVQGRSWNLSAAPRVGFGLASLSFGAVKQLSGYQSPVITEAGDISDGEQLSASMNGWLGGFGLVYDHEITSRIALRIDLGFQYASFNDLKVSTKDVTVDLSSPALVNPGVGSDHANMSPSGSSIGLSGSVGIVYRL